MNSDNSLFESIDKDDVVGAQYLLQEGIEITDKHLQKAIQLSPKIAKLILTHYIPKNLDLALTMAACQGLFDLSKILLEMGAKPNSEQDKNVNCFDVSLYRYYRVYYRESKGFVLYATMYSCNIDLLKLMISFGIDLSVNNNMAINIFSEECYGAGKETETEKVTQFIQEAWKIITEHHQYSQLDIDNAFINAVVRGISAYTRFILRYISTEHSKIIKELFDSEYGNEVHLHGERTILFCLYELNFENNHKQLTLIANEIAMKCNFIYSYEIIKKLLRYQFNITNYLKHFMLLALLNNDVKLIKLLREHLDLTKFLDQIATDITEKGSI